MRFSPTLNLNLPSIWIHFPHFHSLNVNKVHLRYVAMPCPMKVTWVTWFYFRFHSEFIQNLLDIHWMSMGRQILFSQHPHNLRMLWMFRLVMPIVSQLSSRSHFPRSSSSDFLIYFFFANEEHSSSSSAPVHYRRSFPSQVCTASSRSLNLNLSTRCSSLLPDNSTSKQKKICKFIKELVYTEQNALFAFVIKF